jgi:predicted RNA methylase
MKIRSITLPSLIILSATADAAVYEGKVLSVDATALGNPYNSVAVDTDMSASPCATTRANKIVTLRTDVQTSVALAAFMSDKTVVITSTETCVSNIEQIHGIKVK